MTQRDRHLALLILGIAVSAGIHGLTYAAIPLEIAPGRRTLVENPTVDVQVLEPQPEPEPELVPEPEPQPEPIREPEAVRQPEREPVALREPVRELEPEDPPANATDPAPEDEPVRFDNQVLTSPQGAWNIPEGSNRDREGPIGVPTLNRGRGNQTATQDGTGRDGPATPNLSRRPGQPNSLRRTLESIYRSMPAHSQELEGEAVVRVQINADGSVLVLGITSESSPGFGDACRRALLQGGRWEPGLDGSGWPVVHRIPAFPCRFRQQ